MKFYLLLFFIVVDIAAQGALLNMINRGLGALSKITEPVFSKHTTFTSKYHKKYSSTSELTFRAVVFNSNLNAIENNNKNLSNCHLMGVTRFFDMTSDEFKGKVLMGSLPKFGASNTTVIRTNTTKGSVSWRAKNMTGVI